jgi:eukaryotic-like serine/threonine-protein kinase
VSTEAPKEGEEAKVGKSKGPDPLIGRVVNDRFRIVSVIARGGMGKVYRAEQSPLGREVALKVLNPNYSGEQDPEFHKRFFLEASICAKLTHPNTVTIFDYGRTDDDVYYIAMELLEGRTLHRALREETRFPADRTMHVARQMCRSLREAHALGVIHRDLKPANIYLVRHGDERDFVKVLDFGLVKDLDKGEDLTQTGLFMGSPKYMAPEQIRGEKVDGRCDVYALGVIMFEMLTGKVPFDRPNSVNILMAHVHEQPPLMSDMAPDADIDPMLEQVVLKAMAKKPEERFSGMDELLVALKHVAQQSGLAVSRSGEMGVSSEYAVGGGSTGAFAAVRISGDASGAVPTPSGSAMQPPIAAPSDELLDSAPFADPNRKSKAMLFVGAALVLAALVGGWMALRKDEPIPVADTDPNTTGTTTGTSGTTATTTTEPTMDTAPVEARVVVSLRSTPPGATVLVGDAEYGPTPAEVTWLGADAAVGREVTFQFQLEGHRDFTITRTVIGETLDVEATLEEMRDDRRVIRRPPRPRTTTMTTMETSSGTSIGIKGYKAEPY